MLSAPERVFEKMLRTFSRISQNTLANCSLRFRLVVISCCNVEVIKSPSRHLLNRCAQAHMGGTSRLRHGLFHLTVDLIPGPHRIPSPLLLRLLGK